MHAIILEKCYLGKSLVQYRSQLPGEPIDHFLTDLRAKLQHASLANHSL